MNTATESLLLHQWLDYCRLVFPIKSFPNGQNLSTELGQLDEKKMYPFVDIKMQVLSFGEFARFVLGVLFCCRSFLKFDDGEPLSHQHVWKLYSS